MSLVVLLWNFPFLLFGKEMRLISRLNALRRSPIATEMSWTRKLRQTTTSVQQHTQSLKSVIGMEDEDMSHVKHQHDTFIAPRWWIAAFIGRRRCL